MQTGIKVNEYNRIKKKKLKISSRELVFSSVIMASGMSFVHIAYANLLPECVY